LKEIRVSPERMENQLEELKITKRNRYIERKERKRGERAGGKMASGWAVCKLEKQR
jgi:hypothetical protein